MPGINMFFLLRLTRFVLLCSLLAGGAFAHAQQGEQLPDVFGSIDAVRTGQYGQPALTQDPLLNTFAAGLLPTFADDCTFFAGDDDDIGAALGYTNSVFEVVRLCGVNLGNADAINTFTKEISRQSGAPLISETRFSAVGLAYEQVTQRPGVVQARYVMVLGVSSLPPVPTSFSSVQKVPAFNLTFNYPDAWASDPNSITLAARPDDLPAATDGDSSTKAQDSFITFNAFPLEALGLTPSTARLDSLQAIVQQTLGLVVEEESEAPVFAYRARTLRGTDANNDAGLVTFWLQDGHLMLFILSAPNAASAQAWQPAWGQILASVQPTQALLPLTQQVSSQFMNINISYPDGWVVVDRPDRFGIFEQKIDAGVYESGAEGVVPFVGLSLTALYQSADELIAQGNLQDTNLEGLYAFATWLVPFNNPQVTETWVMGQPALSIQGEAGGVFGHGVIGIVNEHVYYVLVSSTNQQDLADFSPTFFAMMTRFVAGS